MAQPNTARTQRDITNDAEDARRTKRGDAADASAEVVATQEASDKRRNESNLRRGGVVDETPRIMDGEGVVQFAGRMKEYRRKKQSAQADALR